MLFAPRLHLETHGIERSHGLPLLVMRRDRTRVYAAVDRTLGLFVPDLHCSLLGDLAVLQFEHGMTEHLAALG